MGGGAGVSTGGGLLGKAAIYGIVRLGNELGLAIEAGLTRAPGGNFSATQGSAALVWALDAPGGGGAARAAGANRLRRRRRSLRRAAQRRRRARSLSAAALKLDRFLTANLYVTGLRSRARPAAARAAIPPALAGIGWNQPLGARLESAPSSPQAPPAAAASTSGGVLVEPRLYAGVQAHPGARPARRRGPYQGDARHARQQALRRGARLHLRRRQRQLRACHATRGLT